MALQEVELENLIETDKLAVTIANSYFPSGLTNKYLCYITGSPGSFNEKHYQFVLAVLSDGSEEKECSTFSLVLPPEKGQILFISREHIIKINNEIDLLKEETFNQKLIQVVFSQDSLEAVELLLHQNIFSPQRIIQISIGYPHVLDFILSERIVQFGKVLFDIFTDGNTLLHLCVDANNSAGLKFILDKLQDTTFQLLQEVTKERIQQFVELANESDNTALQIAVLKQRHESLVILLRAGADIGIVDINGNSLFHFACYLDDTVSVEIIFNFFQSSTTENGGLILKREMSRMNKQMCPSVVVAKVSGIIDKFLSYLDLNEEFGEEGNLLIHLACKFNNICLVGKLVELYVDLNVVNKYSLNPLKIAVIEGNVDIVKLLLGAGVSVAEKDSVLFLAAEKGHLILVKMFIDLGVSLYHGDMNLLHACVKGDSSDLIEYLVREQKLNINALDSNGESPLFRTVRSGCKLSVRCLLLNGADPNQINGNRESMLIHAVKHGLVEIVKLLVQYRADTNYVTPDGMNAFMIACRNNQVDILSLLSHLITPETLKIRDRNGNNLCHIAAINDAKSSFAFLLENLAGKLSKEQFKDVIYMELNNEGLNLYNIMFRSNSKNLKEYLSHAPVEYFLDHPSELHNLYDQGYYDLLVVILDKFVVWGDKVFVHTKYFDAIDDGSYPGDKGFHYFKQSFFHKLLSCPDEELKYHPVVSLLAECKYIPYRLVSYLELMMHSFFLFVFAFALITASYTCEADLFLYNDTLSWCRLASEILSLVFIAAFATMSFLNFISEWLQVYENKSELHSEGFEIFLMHTSNRISFASHLFRETQRGVFSRMNWVDKKTKNFFPALVHYLLQFYIFFDSLAFISAIILVVLRFARNQTQWAFASLTFLLISLNLLKYIRVLPKLGAYIASILQIFLTDIPKFVIVVIVVLISFIGSAHLAGRFEAQLRQANNSICLNQSSFIFWLNEPETLTYTLLNPFYSGGIFLLDGGPSNVEEDLRTANFIFAFIYLFFAFLFIIVLINILIAQLSQTYAEISAEREFYFILQLAVHYELLSGNNLLFGSYFRPRSVIDHIIVSGDKWKKYLDKSPSRSSELLARDVDLRSREMGKQMDTLQIFLNKMKSALSVTSDKVAHLYENATEKKGGYFSGKPSRNLAANVEEEQVSNRLDALESKMEKIIQLLENK